LIIYYNYSRKGANIFNKKKTWGVSYPSWLWRRKSWLSKRLNAQRWTTARNAVDIDVRITIFRALCQWGKKEFDLKGWSHEMD
jgi:hypothetical protein